MENRVEGENTSLENLYTLHRKFAVRSTVAVAFTMILVFSVGLHTYIMMINSESGAFWPAVPMLLGVVFAYTGLNLKILGRPMMIASMVFMAIAVLMCFIAAIADGAAAQDIHHTDFRMCFYAENDDFTPPCIDNDTRQYNIYPKRSCNCCSQWKNAYITTTWYNVDACETISHTFQGFLWTSVACNIFAVVVCVMSCSSIGGYLSSITARNHTGQVIAGPVHYVPTVGENVAMTAAPQPRRDVAQTPPNPPFPGVSTGARDWETFDQDERHLQITTNFRTYDHTALVETDVL
ncbi:transmembrane protein 255A-like [Styela clava]